MASYMLVGSLTVVNFLIGVIMLFYVSDRGVREEIFETVAAYAECWADDVVDSGLVYVGY